MGILVRLASRWVAGVHMDEALVRTRRINKDGIGAIVNILGEHYEDRESVEETVNEYLKLLDKIKEADLDAGVSIKLSQFGLMISEEYCRKNVERILRKVMEQAGFLWIDMEDARFTDATVRIYEMCLERHPLVGLAVQTNLKRTEADVRRLVKKGGRIRLCKGAYNEDPAISYPKRRETTVNYSRIMKMLFEEGDNFAIGTHDMNMIKEALELNKVHKRSFEFQMLQGVRETTAIDLARRGYRVVEYVPYGPRWIAYFSRRLKERPGNVITMFRSLVSG